MEIEFQRIEDRSVNYVEVCIYTELGCDPSRGEYSVVISSFIGSLDISSIGGVDDVSLIQQCIENSIDEINLPSEGCAQVILKESGEWQDMFWHKYYEIERMTILGN
jgi:hypothetical protein